MKKNRPYRILRKILANAYELVLPNHIGISTIFNVAYLYHYKGDKDDSSIETLEDIEEQEETWK